MCPSLRLSSSSSPQAKKHTIQERDRAAVTALLWSHSGSQLYCGYVSGRLLCVSFRFDQGWLQAEPLLECGSPIHQLSLSVGGSLLISTLARSLLLDTASGRVTQVRVGGEERGALSVVCSL